MAKDWRAILAGDRRLAAPPGTGRAMQVRSAAADLRRAPRGDEGLDTELLHGEIFHVFETREGWAYGQAGRDLYVGYVSEDALAPPGPGATHVVAVPRTLVFPAPDIKLTPLMALSLNARLAVRALEGRFAALQEGGFVPAGHLAPLGAHADDYAGVAEQFLHVPYYWGGRTGFGLDCSGLVQSALQRAGIDAPRDTDMQEKTLGAPAAVAGPYRRGDLVFWKGHVGIMLDGERLLHANAFHMAVAIEPLTEARARILAAGAPVTSVKRL